MKVAGIVPQHDSTRIRRFALDEQVVLLSKVSESSRLASGADWQALSTCEQNGSHPCFKNRKILVTGGTGQIAGPIAEDFARHNEVWIAARFSNPDRKAQLEALGIKTCVWDMVIPYRIFDVAKRRRIFRTCPDDVIE